MWLFGSIWHISLLSQAWTPLYQLDISDPGKRLLATRGLWPCFPVSLFQWEVNILSRNFFLLIFPFWRPTNGHCLQLNWWKLDLENRELYTHCAVVFEKACLRMEAQDIATSMLQNTSVGCFSVRWSKMWRGYYDTLTAFFLCPQPIFTHRRFLGTSLLGHISP